jgi:16S rRNA (adenine1518-N6/adenine1519-N6)-dimethyltransferase
VADAAPRPRKRFGQHFLTDPRILGRIAEAATAHDAETLIEIGPGRGALTDHLVERARRLVVIEIDRDLATQLKTRYADRANVEIVQGDVLERDLAALASPPFAVAGNIPYYITTPILFHVLRSPMPVSAVFLVQREVADRMAASAGSETYGALSVGVQAVAQVEHVMRVRAGAFTPPPKVESSVVRLAPREPRLVDPQHEKRFRRLVQGAFGFRRKQMRRVLRELAGVDPSVATELLERAGIDPESRPETIAPETFVVLLETLDAAKISDTLERRK